MWIGKLEHFYASAQHSVAGSIMVLSCSCACVCASGTRTLLTRYLAEYLIHSPNLHQRCFMGQRWTLHSLGSKGQRSRSRWNKVCWKQHFLGLLARCFEKYYSDFQQTYTNDGLWDGDECIKFWNQKITVQDHGGITYAGTITVWAEGGIQYSTFHVEVDFLVVFWYKDLIPLTEDLEYAYFQTLLSVSFYSDDDLRFVVGIVLCAECCRVLLHFPRWNGKFYCVNLRQSSQKISQTTQCFGSTRSLALCKWKCLILLVHISTVSFKSLFIKYTFYRAMHVVLVWYCYRKSSVCPSVTLMYAGHNGLWDGDELLDQFKINYTTN